MACSAGPGKQTLAERTLAQDPAGQGQGVAAIPVDDKGAGRFYSILRRRIMAWLDGHGPTSGKGEQWLLLLPDLLALLVRLIRDPRVPWSLKKDLVPAVLYYLSPIDLVPDFLLPVGLVDDAVAIAFILTRAVNIMGLAGEDILREHWEGQEDVLLAISRIAVQASRVLSPGVVGRLRKMFRRG